MRNFKNNIDRLVSKVLNEEIENKVKQISEEMGEWTEIEVDEQQLKGGQKFIAKQAEPKDKITGADFKKLRDKKETKETEEIDEFYFYDDEDESVPGDYEGDEEAEDKAEELSAQEPTYVGKGLGDNNWDVSRKPNMIGSFDDEHGFYDEYDRQYTGDFDFDFDEEEFDELEPMMKKHGDSRWFQKGPDGERMFNMYKEKHGPMKVRTKKMGNEMSEEDKVNSHVAKMMDEIFAESKIDKVLTSYFNIS